MKITPWSSAEIKAFVEWHEAVLQSNNYGPTVTTELRAARDKFLFGVAQPI